MASITPEQSIKSALSAARMGTYEVAATVVPKLPVLAEALALYAWNAQVSAALMVPLHVCEVVIRNAVSDALERVYGPAWPWSPGFERSLPAPSHGYSVKNDLLNVRNRFPTTGKVIPELKFIFGKPCSRAGLTAAYGILICWLFSRIWTQRSRFHNCVVGFSPTWRRCALCATASLTMSRSSAVT